MDFRKIIDTICKWFTCRCHSDCDFKAGNARSPKKDDVVKTEIVLNP